MKTAKEVFRFFYTACFDTEGHQCVDHAELRRYFSESLAAYADERAKDCALSLERWKKRSEYLEKYAKTVRIGALEEARIKTLCNNIPAGSDDFQDGWTRACEFIDEQIRTLKKKL